MGVDACRLGQDCHSALLLFASEMSRRVRGPLQFSMNNHLVVYILSELWGRGLYQLRTVFAEAVPAVFLFYMLLRFVHCSVLKSISFFGRVLV